MLSLPEAGMIPFDVRLFCRIVFRSFFRSGHTDAPLTWRRAALLTLGLLAFVAFEFFNLICLVCDELIFPGYRRVTLTEPIFIIGNPRSGTTFLHRVLAADRRFFVFRTWDILFPAIIQKKLLHLLGRLDRSFGSPGRRLVERVERRILGRFLDLHSTGLFQPEEDEMLFLHCFSSLYLVFFFPLYEDLRAFVRFDVEMDPARRQRLMRFYVGCVRRQCYVSGGQRTFLSKNPMFSAKVESLLEWFPDCRLIYLVRNPLEAIPSMLSEGYATCVYADSRNPPSVTFQENLYEVSKIFYRYPLARLDARADVERRIVKYADLARRPGETIRHLYRDFGLDMTDEFRRRLGEEDARARHYQSRHRYSIDQFAIQQERITRELADIFDRFGFSARGRP